MDGLSSMENVLVEMKKSGSKEIMFEQRRELTWSMVNWARAVSQFVKTASKKKRVSFVDISSFENYYDSNVLVSSKRAHDEKPKKDHYNGENVSKRTSANNTSNSTKPK